MHKPTGWSLIWEPLAKQVGDIVIPLSLRWKPLRQISCAIGDTATDKAQVSAADVAMRSR